MSNVEVVAFLTRHGVDFEHWPHGLLPPAASAYLQEVARTSFEERHEESLLGTEDILVLDEYLASCVSEKPIIRTEWGYLTGDQSPRWVDGTLTLMHTIGIASYMAGNTTANPRIRTSFADLLKAEVKGHVGVDIWPGSDVELCCVVAQCACTESVLNDELKQIQIVDFLIGVLRGNRLGQMICLAVQMDVDGKDGNSMVDSCSMPESPHYH